MLPDGLEHTPTAKLADSYMQLAGDNAWYQQAAGAQTFSKAVVCEVLKGCAGQKGTPYVIHTQAAAGSDLVGGSCSLYDIFSGT